MDKKFSIITPSFNQGRYINQTVKSVILQKKNISLEYFIIDGLSTDSTSEIINNHIDKIDHYISEKDSGQSNAINKGIIRANGAFINWLNSDDYYEPNAMETINALIDHDTNAVFCKSNLFNKDGIVKVSRGTDIYENNLPKTIGWARIDQPESFFSLSAWKKVGLLNESLHYVMDKEWWIRYLYHRGLRGIVKSNDIIVNFRLHDESKTTVAQNSFLREEKSIYFQMGKVADHQKGIELLKGAFEIDEQISTDIASWTNTELAYRSFNYFILKVAHEAYADDNRSMCKDLLAAVDDSFIAFSDQRLIRKMKIRLKVPLSIIHFFRK